VTRRLHELDALRGFAVCGIMVVNTWQHTREHLKSPGQNAVDWAIDNLLQSRFYPIFSFLFGLSFALFLRSAEGRTAHPRLVLLRRLAVLACFGAAHQLINPGEVLLPYAIYGVVVLIPASFLPRALVLAAGVGTVLWALLNNNPWILIAGLFPLGMALIRDAPPPRSPAPVFAVSAVAGAAGTGLWAYLARHPEYFGGAPYLVDVYMVAGVMAAVAYSTGVLLLVRARRRISAVLEPLGRMALTNYLSSTPVILAALPLLTADRTRWSVAGFSLAVLVAQAAFGRWWLARFRYGPLEWVWRCGTWWRIVPNRRKWEHAHSPLPDPRQPRPRDEPGTGA
jgi:uncharacterized membrane protein YeiB